VQIKIFRPRCKEKKRMRLLVAFVCLPHAHLQLPTVGSSTPKRIAFQCANSSRKDQFHQTKGLHSQTMYDATTVDPSKKSVTVFWMTSCSRCARLKRVETSVDTQVIVSCPLRQSLSRRRHPLERRPRTRTHSHTHTHIHTRRRRQDFASPVGRGKRPTMTIGWHSCVRRYRQRQREMALLRWWRRRRRHPSTVFVVDTNDSSSSAPVAAAERRSMHGSA
jgi:hypothetical protein